MHPSAVIERAVMTLTRWKEQPISNLFLHNLDTSYISATSRPFPPARIGASEIMAKCFFIVLVERLLQTISAVLRLTTSTSFFVSALHTYMSGLHVIKNTIPHHISELMVSMVLGTCNLETQNGCPSCNRVYCDVPVLYGAL